MGRPSVWEMTNSLCLSIYTVYTQHAGECNLFFVCARPCCPEGGSSSFKPEVGAAGERAREQLGEELERLMDILGIGRSDGMLAYYPRRM
jgi:hypothetical protein